MVVQAPPLVLTSKEQSLIRYIRLLGYGKLSVIVQNNEPIRIEEALKQTSL